MAIFRLEAKLFGREKRGRSVVAGAAYRAGSKLKDERGDKTYDYTKKAGVIHSVILAPEGAPEWVRQPEALWNTVERGEKRADAQLAREFILALPRELDAKAQLETAVGWAQRELVSRGMVAEVSLHHSRDEMNPHAHILCTLRRLDGDKFSDKKAREWNDVALLVAQRESWAAAVNVALEKAGRTERVDHRSLKDRGIDKIPEPKIGVAATAMKRRGLVPDTERHRLVRFVKSLNFARPWMEAIRKTGEVRQEGMGGSWWERSLIFLAERKEAVQRTVMDTWQSLKYPSVGHSLPGHDQNPPERDQERER